jgi:choice-of-anchor A domain-containing protein/uncharacterized repeat protein (TIGR01451 family)/TQXA domain-containing protein
VKTLFTVTSRVIIGMILLLALNTTASAQKILGVKKVADHTSQITMSSTGEGTNVTFTGHNNQFAGVITGTLNSNTIKFYCIDLFNPVNPGSHPVYWDEGTTPAALTYILNNYYPVNTNAAGKLSSVNQEAAAVQLAIWHFSDNLVVSSITDATIKDRVQDIIADATANAGTSNPLQTLQIIPASQSVAQGGTATFKVKALTLSGGAAANVTIHLSTTGGTLSTSTITTGANGETSSITLTNGSNAGSIVITASAEVAIPQGTVYVAKVEPTTHQRIVLSSPTTDTKEVHSTIEFTACKSKIGDFVWHDLNTNGIQDANEPGIPGVTVELLQSNVVKATAVTDANGAYSFIDKDNGTYTVRIAASNFTGTGVLAGSASSKWYYTKKNQGTDTKDNDADANTNPSVTLSCGDNLTVDFGFYKSCVTVTKVADKQTAKPGDQIKYTFTIENCGDVVLHGGVTVKDALVGLDTNYVLEAHTTSTFSRNYKVKATDCGNLVNNVSVLGHPFLDYGLSTQVTLDDITNAASFTVVINCKASLGDKVWLDTDKDGIQDAGENGIANVTVKLYACNGALVSTTTTDANGNYLFGNLTPGDYSVEFVKPAGYTITTANQGSNDAVDSDADASTGKTICTTLVAAENDLTWDCGMYMTPASLGDKVWIDANKNGIQDNGEAGKEGVTVKLFTCANVLVSTTTTDANGLYLFNNLTPGDYYVEFTKPAGYVFTSMNAGTNDAVDSDVDLTSGKTVCTTLDAGENDMTWDAGIYEQVASIGDKVWEDTNKNGIQDNTENGISGVTVKLYTCAGVLQATTTTDGNGSYLFSNLAPGSYYVEFTKPAGYLATGKDAGSNDAVDSDADVTTGRTICTDLAANENDLTWDAGFYKEPEKADLKIEKTTSKVNPACGDNVTYTIKVTNLGPNAASGVVVNDLLPSGMQYVSSSATVGSYNNTTGLWTVGSLSNGASATLSISVKVDCGSSNSSINLGYATDFNLFVLEDLIQPSSDTQGKIAVGHNAIISDYSVGDQLPANSGDVLVVGNNLSLTSGDVFNGNVVYGNATNLPTYSVTIAGTLTQGTPINFTAAKSALEGLSASLAAYTVNGTTTFQWGGLKLTGTNPTLNIFKVNGSDLSSANDFQVTVPTGSVALINITGTNVSWSGGLEVHGTAITNVLYNFYQATDLTIADIDVRGSILAPFAALNYNSGVINGQVIVKSMTGNGQFNLCLFLGNIPVGKVITNVATVTSQTLDENLANNTASASVTVSSTTSSNGTTGIGDITELPKEVKLAQNYPNPFNPSTVIEFSIPAAGSYSLKVYDVIGQEVATLVNSSLSVGTHKVTFDAGRMASGMYIYRLVGNNVNITRKMLLTK